MALSAHGLRRELSFGELIHAVHATGLKLDGDNLYNEFDILCTAMPKLSAQDEPDDLR